MSGPAITVDLEKIEKNTQIITRFCADHGIDVIGVTKATCGMPSVAGAMIRGGVKGIGESRIENINRLLMSGINVPVTLLRIPPLSAAREVVSLSDVSLNSELPVIKELSLAAEETGKVHDIILMVDLGDLREGIWPDDLLSAAEEVHALPGIRIRGIGTNLTCYGGVLPSRENMKQLVEYAERVEDRLGIPMEIISAGNSSALELVKEGKMPEQVNQLRIGEAILLGRETAYGRTWPGLSTDAFVLKAELIEVKEKPSVPIGETGMDAFGEKPVFEDRGKMRRGILNIGREDVAVDGIIPVDSGISILGASSDHLLVDLTEAAGNVKLGEEVSFTMNYGALLAGMTSSYVLKEPLKSGGIKKIKRVVLSGDSPVFSDRDLRKNLEKTGCRVYGPGPSDPISLEEIFRSGAVPFIAGRERITLRGMTAMKNVIGQSGLILLDSHPSLLTDPKAPADRRILSEALGLLEKGEGLNADFSPENMVLIGIREAGREESEIIRRFGISAYTMEDIDLLGIREVIKRSLRTAGTGTGGIYVSFCQNVIDRSGEGLTARELHLAMELIAGSDLMRAMDVSGCLKRGQKDYSQLVRFVESAFGKRILM